MLILINDNFRSIYFLVFFFF